MKTISIHKPDGILYFETGAKIIREGKETDIVVTKISCWFRKVVITLSNKEKLIYNNFPISYTNDIM